MTRKLPAFAAVVGLAILQASCVPMVASGAEVSIVLVTDAGAPMPVFYVTAVNSVHASRTARADVRGEARFLLPAGAWRIDVETGSQKQVERPIITVRSGVDQRVTLAIDPVTRCLLHR